MQNYSLFISLTIPLTLVGLSFHYFLKSKNVQEEEKRLSKKSNGYLGCLYSSSNLLKMILRNVSDQVAKIDYIKSVNKEGYINSNISFNSLEYVKELMNITKNSEKLSTLNNGLQDYNENEEKSSNFLIMVLVPYISIIFITISANLVIYFISPKSLELVNILLLTLISIIALAVLLFGYKTLTKKQHIYNSSRLVNLRFEKDMKIQLSNIKSFENVITDYLYMLNLYIPDNDNNLRDEIDACITVIEKYNQQVAEVSNILNSKSHSTDLNDVLQKVLLTRVNDTDALGVEINASSEHPLFVDIDESSLYFVLLTLIDNVMKKSSKGAFIDFKAKRQKNVASVSIISKVTLKQMENSNESTRLDSLNPEIILPSEEGIDMYVIKTILDRFGGDIAIKSRDSKNVINLALQLESNSAY